MSISDNEAGLRLDRDLGGGSQASPAAEWLRADRDRNGRVIVEPDLRVPGHANIFAIGDTASAIGMNGKTPPAVAPVAKQQGRYVADFILGRAPTAVPLPRLRQFRDRSAATRRSSTWARFKLSGFLAWLIWSAAHIWFLIGFRSRLSVTIAWLWNYLTYQRSARLITGEIGRPTPPAALPKRSKGNAHEVARREVAKLGQTVLVLQGGGALGAYQVGVYEALHEAGSRARLGDRHVDRRNQRVADCRQQAGRADRQAVRVLVARSERPSDSRRLTDLDGQRGAEHARRDQRRAGLLQPQSDGFPQSAQQARAPMPPAITASSRCAGRSRS